jgi:hypothetical protein
MASSQEEETRIRRILGKSSFGLATLERYLFDEGHVPDSAEEEAAREAVCKLRERYILAKALNTPMQGLFESSSLGAITPAEKLEADSVKYDAVRDLIHMVAIRKAQALTAQREEENFNVAIAVKSW